MDELIKKLAKVNSFKLNIKYTGSLIFKLDVDYEDGLSQGLGGLVLDNYNIVTGERIGTAYGCEMIRQLMLTLDVDDFNEVKNKIIYVLGEGEGFQFKAKGIETLNVYGNVKTLIFDDVREMFQSLINDKESDKESDNA